MGTDDVFKSIKIVSFDGNEEDNFREWKSKTEAIGSVNGWWDQVMDDTESVLLISKKTTDKTELEVLKQEKAAKMYFTLACSNKAFQYIVDKDTAFSMFKSLKDQYEPNEEDDYILLTTEFLKCRMKDESQDPETWFHQLDYICQRMKNINPAYEKKDMEVKTFILSQLPDVYSEVVTNEIKTMKTTSLKKIKSEIVKFYKRTYKNKDIKSSFEEKDEALTIERRPPVNPHTGKINGKCSCCGLKGHGKQNCFHKDKTCGSCNKKGHLAEV